jgi:ubiquinone/menaquinone biosynthesis C-methylase UbiE
MATSRTEALEELHHELARHTREDMRAQFGSLPESWNEYATDYFWEESCQDERLRELTELGVRPGARILDVAGGHGQFVFRALDQGYDAWGIEPDLWKLDFAARKLRATRRPAEWSSRLIRGVGERMPVPDASFDVVTSFQTLEHVQHPSEVVSEMLRVTRAGGLIHVRCPDYRSLFEGHYRLPWLPLMPRALARAYLRIAGRPTDGLAQIRYVTRPRVVALFRKAAEATSRKVRVENLNARLFESSRRKRHLPKIPGGYMAWRGMWYLRTAFRQELSVAIVVRAD